MAAQDTEDIEQLAIRLREAAEREDDASESESSIGEAQTNRFNKLKRKSRFVNRGHLNTVGGLRSDTVFSYYGTKKRATISARKSASNSSVDEEDAYTEVSLEEVLAPINEPSNIITHSAHRTTFQRQALRILANHAQETINTEHEHRVQLSRLLTAFLGDEPSLIMEMYDKEAPDTKLQTLLHGLPSSEEATRATTRHAAAVEENALLAGDFVTPQYDRNLGLMAEEAEEARRLLQAALDRSEEYLRCMQRVRAGLVRADRFRKLAWRWAKDSTDENA